MNRNTPVKKIESAILFSSEFMLQSPVSAAFIAQPATAKPIPIDTSIKVTFAADATATAEIVIYNNLSRGFYC